MVAMGLYLIGFKLLCILSLCKIEIYHLMFEQLEEFRFIYSKILFAINIFGFITVNLASYVLFIRQKKRKVCH